jgi:hypothetical protein
MQSVYREEKSVNSVSMECMWSENRVYLKSI